MRSKGAGYAYIRAVAYLYPHPRDTFPLPPRPACCAPRATTQAQISLSELKAGRAEWDLVNSKYIAGGAKPKKKYKNSGILKLVAFEMLPEEAAKSVVKFKLSAAGVDKKDKGQ